MKTKNKNRLICLMLVLSVLFTALSGINVSAKKVSVANQSFYEDFEDYSGAVYTASSGIAGKMYNDYPLRVPVGANLTEFKITPIDTTAVTDNTKAGSTAFKMSTKSAQAAAAGVYLNPEIEIGTEDIIISGDVYIPAINPADGKQYIRFQVTRGLEDNGNKNDMPGWQTYNEFLDPAFGMYIDSSGSNAWCASIVAPREQNKVNEYDPKSMTGLSFTPETWYNICFVYHPAEGGVDYYINGEFIETHPVGDSWAADGKTGTYIIPNLAPGKALGNIVLIGGGCVDEECAAIYDNISVVKATAVDEAKYAEIKNGADYVYANWDVPALKSSVESATVEVKKNMDVTFSSGTTLAEKEYTIDYTSSNGVGIKFKSPIKDSYGRYQIKVSGIKDIYGNTVDRIYNFSVGGAVEEIERFTEKFDTATGKWESNWGAEYLEVTEEENGGGRNGVLKARALQAYPMTQNALDAHYLDIPVVDAGVEYVDVEFDLYATVDTSVEGYEDSYVNYFFIGHDFGANFKKAAAFSIWKDKVGLVSCAGQDMGSDFYATVADNPDVAGLDKWITYKMRYYPAEGDIEIYAGDMNTPVITAKTYNNKTDKAVQKWSDLGDGRNSVTRFGMQTTKVGSVTYIDNMSIKSYGYSAGGSVVKAVTFEDAGSKMLDNKAGAKNIKIYLANADEAPVVSLNGASVGGMFDPTSGVFEAELPQMLVGNTDYTITVNGDDYAFTTGEGEFTALNLRFENSDGLVTALKDGDTITAKADIFNSTEIPMEPYLIWVAYDGSEVKWVDLEKIDAVAGYADTAVGQAVTVESDYTMVKAFLWDGIDTLAKLTEDCVIDRTGASAVAGAYGSADELSVMIGDFDDEGVASISGKFATPEEKYVSVMIIAPDTDIDNIGVSGSNKIETVPFVGSTVADADGEFEMEITLKGLSGEYSAHFGPSEEGTLEVPVYFWNKGENTTALSTLNSKANSAQGNEGVADVEKFVDENADALAFRFSLYEGEDSVNHTEVIKMLIADLDKKSFDTDDTIGASEHFRTLVFARALEEGKALELDAYAPYLPIFTSADGLLKDWYAEADNAEKKELVERLTKLDYTTKESFDEKAVEMAILTRIHHADGDGEVREVLEGFEDYTGISTSGLKQAVYDGLEREKIDDYAELEAIIEELKESSSKKTSSSGGGGGGGGGGSMPSAMISNEYSDTSEKIEPIAEEAEGFADVSEGDWYYDAVYELYDRGIIAGKSENTFVPEDSITREEIVKMLVVMENLTLTDSDAGFADVNEDDWFCPYVNAAAEYGIVKGVGDGIFGTGQNVTRQDIAVMLYNIAKSKGITTETTELTFTDAEEISDYAKDAVLMLSELKVINGYEDSSFKPQNFVTRAEAAKLICEFIDIK